MSRVSWATATPLVFRQVAQRPHVVEPVGQLDEDHADVVDHRQEHLPEVLRLAFLAGGEADRADFGDPLDHMGDFGAEKLANPVDGGEGVLDDVVEQAGRDRHDVQFHVGEEVGHGQGVNQVGLPGMAHLAAVLEGGKDIGPPEQLNVGVRAVGTDFFEQILEANHENRCLTILLTCVFLLHYTGPVSATAIFASMMNRG